jgi:hypothetical protein
MAFLRTLMAQYGFISPFLLCLSVLSVHVLAIRHILLDELAIISDRTILIDSAQNLFVAVLLAAVSARIGYFLICSQSKGFTRAYFLFEYIFRRHPTKSRAETVDVKVRVSTRWLLRNQQKVELVVFVFALLAGYIDFEPDELGVMFFVFCLGMWVFLMIEVLWNRALLAKVRDTKEAGKRLRRRSLLPLYLSIGAVNLIIISWLLGVARAYTLENGANSIIYLKNGDEICLVIVAKNQSGLFAFDPQPNELRPTRYLPYESITMVIEPIQGQRGCEDSTSKKS